MTATHPDNSNMVPMHGASGQAEFAPDDSDFNSSSFDIAVVVSALLRWRWLMLGALLLCLLLAAVYTFLATPQYAAMATMEIRQQPIELIEGSAVEQVAVRDPTFMETQFALLRSGSLALRVARDLRLAGNPALDVPEGVTRAGREAYAVRYITNGLNIRQMGSSRLVEIRFVGDDPQIAADIANSYVRNFISSDGERRESLTASARRLLADRVEQAKATLEASERAFVAYAQQQGIVEVRPIATGPGAGGSDGSGSLDATTLVATNTALTAAQVERISAQQRYEQARSAGISRDGLNSSAAQAMQAELSRLQAEYAQQSQTYLDSYPAQVALRARINELQSELQRQQGQFLRTLRSEYQAAAATETELRARLDELQGTLIDTRNKSIEYTILQREVQTNRTLYDALLQRFKEVGVAGQIGSDLAAPVDPAAPASRPTSPNLLFNLVLALLGGLALGGALVFAAFIMDDTIKSVDDVRRILKLPALGMVPEADVGAGFIEVLNDSQSPVSEAYFSIRAATDFATNRGAPRSIAITSATPGEGKSSSCVGLARSFAKNAKRVLIIDADMRRPTLTSRGGSATADATRGLSLLLTSNSALADHIEPTTIENVWAVRSGPLPPSPTELLSSHKMTTVLRDAESQFDLVIVDSPPVLGLADAPLIGALCEAMIFAVRSGGPRRKVVQGAIGRLRHSGANLIGAIVTFMSASRGGYYYADKYQYNYGPGGKKEGQGSTRKLEILQP